MSRPEAFLADDEHPGPTVARWRAVVDAAGLGQLGDADQRGPGDGWRRVVVVSPHPDDDVLGVGGLLARLATAGAAIEVCAVTDGEASHPRHTWPPGADLAKIRVDEAAQAWSHLGLSNVGCHLRLPDGDVGGHTEALTAWLGERLGPADLCLAPWRADGHPDHDACGSAAAQVCAARGARLVEYVVWAPHRLEAWEEVRRLGCRPDGPAGSDRGVSLPWESCVRVDLTLREQEAKRQAVSAFASQIRPWGRPGHQRRVLPPLMVERALMGCEVLVT